MDITLEGPVSHHQQQLQCEMTSIDDDPALLVNDEFAVAPEVIVPVEKHTRGAQIVRLSLRFCDNWLKVDFV